MKNINKQRNIDLKQGKWKILNVSKMALKDEIFQKYIDELRTSIPQYGEIINALLELYNGKSDFSTQNLIQLIESKVIKDD